MREFHKYSRDTVKKSVCERERRKGDEETEKGGRERGRESYNTSFIIHIFELLNINLFNCIICKFSIVAKTLFSIRIGTDVLQTLRP